MALVSSTLATTLLTSYIPTMTDSTFASAMASGINSFVSTGQITASAVAGTVSAGAFTGTAVGTMSVSISSSDIEDVCKQMYKAVTDIADGYNNETDDSSLQQLRQKIQDASNNYGAKYFAQEVASIIDDACTNGTFVVTITGNAVQGPTTTPLVDNANITWAGDKSTLQSSLESAMLLIDDSAIATAIAAAVNTYLTTATITVSGSSTTSGATGVGMMA